MKDIRIYHEDIGDRYPWHVRADVCTERDAAVCNAEKDDHAYCDDYTTYRQLIDDLEFALEVMEEG